MADAEDDPCARKASPSGDTMQAKAASAQRRFASSPVSIIIIIIIIMSFSSHSILSLCPLKKNKNQPNHDNKGDGGVSNSNFSNTLHHQRQLPQRQCHRHDRKVSKTVRLT